ncbi:aromatic-ring hydroxylase C-terminal domain-containing protein [Streptomyces rugosispiralis]|uniref:aromatic-ring hydroxylase C-terminal domain-containing protein n=1 Tax=Streptomyces rugosispiralis TaxID=2967341 RepID=UPI00370489E1
MRPRGAPDRIRCASGPVRNGRGLAAVLVRPDGVVAWANDTPDAFEQAAAQWFSAWLRRRAPTPG